MPAQITLKGFPKSCHWLGILANDILSEAYDVFGGSPPLGNKPIEIIRVDDPNSPRVLCPIVDRYKIYICIQDSTLYNQFAYQFSHEICHVFAHPYRTNGHMESICYAFSIHCLERLSMFWLNSNDIWKQSYAGYFSAYRYSTVHQHIDGINSIRSCDLMEKNEAEIKKVLSSIKFPLGSDSPNDRKIQHLLAEILYRSGINWKKVRGIAANTTPSPEDSPDFSNSLSIDFSKLGDELVEILDLVQL
tara:strand:+ start:99 stop:839 length:741 start_codon:yes stop_codon:yes gene_type:complete